MIDCPSGRLPEKDPRWDISWTLLRVSDFFGIYSAGIRSNGAWWGPRGTRARLPPRHALVAHGAHQGLLASPEAFGILLAQEKISKKFHCIWTSFDIDFP